RASGVTARPPCGAPVDDVARVVDGLGDLPARFLELALSLAAGQCERPGRHERRCQRRDPALLRHSRSPRRLPHSAASSSSSPARWMSCPAPSIVLQALTSHAERSSVASSDQRPCRSFIVPNLFLKRSVPFCEKRANAAG